MSEPEGKAELVGLARSIDALFSGVTAPSTSPPESPEAVPDPAPADDAPLDTRPEAGFPLQEPAGDRAVEGESPVEESQRPPDPGPAELLEDEAAEIEVNQAEEMDADQAEEIEANQAAEMDAHADGAPTPTPMTTTADPDSEEPEPGPLDLAVDAFIAGQVEVAGEIKTLADELLDDKEIEPIARAVARLTLAAGIPPDPSVYAVAESIMSPVVLGRLARRIGSERDEESRKEYFAVCRIIGEPMAVAIRNDLADSTDRLARRIHYDALVEMGDASRKVVEEMAVDENRFLVRNAVAILGEVGGDRAVELVTSALANPDARVRREALLSLAKLRDEEAGQLVVGLLDDPDPGVRIAAAIAAGELKIERALRSLIAMLDGSSDPDERPPLIRALGQLGDPGAVASIEKHAVRSLFSRPPTDVRIAAYRALNSIGTPHARRLLNQAVSDKDPEVKAAVKDLLHIR
jgi:HEAT repeats